MLEDSTRLTSGVGVLRRLDGARRSPVLAVKRRRYPIFFMRGEQLRLNFYNPSAASSVAPLCRYP